jgi:hypothetical protein
MKLTCEWKIVLPPVRNNCRTVNTHEVLQITPSEIRKLWILLSRWPADHCRHASASDLLSHTRDAGSQTWRGTTRRRGSPPRQHVSRRRRPLVSVDVPPAPIWRERAEAFELGAGAEGGGPDGVAPARSDRNRGCWSCVRDGGSRETFFHEETSPCGYVRVRLWPVGFFCMGRRLNRMGGLRVK